MEYLDKFILNSISQKTYDLPLKNPKFDFGRKKIPSETGSKKSKIARKRAVLYKECPNCTYCGVHLKEDEATIDHIIPRSKGGSNGVENLCISCRDCNLKKADKIIIKLN